eukprot:366553-Chlamydomonas_euryale.AAC.1
MHIHDSDHLQPRPHSPHTHCRQPATQRTCNPYEYNPTYIHPTCRQPNMHDDNAQPHTPHPKRNATRPSLSTPPLPPPRNLTQRVCHPTGRQPN